MALEPAEIGLTRSVKSNVDNPFYRSILWLTKPNLQIDQGKGESSRCSKHDPRTKVHMKRKRDSRTKSPKELHHGQGLVVKVQSHCCTDHPDDTVQIGLSGCIYGFDGTRILISMRQSSTVTAVAHNYTMHLIHTPVCVVERDSSREYLSSTLP